MALGYLVGDVVAQKNFRSYQGTDQQSLFSKAKQRKDSPDMGAGATENNCKACFNIRGI
jgi:hypothetical protein